MEAQAGDQAEVRPVLAEDAILAAGQGLLASGHVRVSAAGEEVRPGEVGSEDGVVAESQLGEDEGPEEQHSSATAEPWQEEQGPEGGLVSVEQFVAEGQDLTHVVQLWAEDESAGSGGKVWLDLHVGRQEEVWAAEPFGEGEEHEVPGSPDMSGEWNEEQRIQGQLVAGEWLLLEGQVLEEAEEETQAETKEPCEESVKQEQAGPGPLGPCSWSPLQALEALQLEMEPLNERARRAFSRLRRRTWQRRKPHLELRSSIIQRLHGFWAEAFVNHPELSAMISEEDKSLLSFLIDLKVEKGRDHCKMVLLFHRNPYFLNEVIVKEYVISLTGCRPSYSTPIQWHKQYEREAYKRRHNNSSLNFFNWFSDHSLAECGSIVEYICDDLWSNPLKYYLRKVAAPEVAEKGTGLEC